MNEEIQNLEFKIVWELENWKKTEEMKFSMILKAREAEHLCKLNEEIKAKEFEKEKKWKQIEANILSIESKLKSKINDLMKREQKIVLLEEEFKQKTNEISKICAGKDEELTEIKKKMKSEKASFENERSLFK
jgi:centrosomal protein CEP120